MLRNGFVSLIKGLSEQSVAFQHLCEHICLAKLISSPLSPFGFTDARLRAKQQEVKTI